MSRHVYPYRDDTLCVSVTKLLKLAFSPVCADGLHSFEQQVLVDVVHLRLLLREH